LQGQLFGLIASAFFVSGDAGRSWAWLEERKGPMKERSTAPAPAGNTAAPPTRGVVWLVLSLILIVLVFLPILAQ
jgi:hypothetical protein